MNWPEAFERSSAHFASAYLWHDVLADLFGWIAWGLAFGIGFAGIVHLVKCGLFALEEQERKSQGPSDPPSPPPTTGSAARRH